MGKDYYKQGEGKDRYAVYGEDGHMTRFDIISPVANQPGYHHEWWSEKEGYGHEIHPDH